MNTDEQQLFQLTHAQKRIWYREKLFPELREELICPIINFKEDISTDILEKAIIAFIKNNPDIRIRMHLQNGECMQYYSEYRDQKIDMEEFSGSNAENEAEKYFYDQHCLKFELYHSNLYFFSIVKINNTIKLYIKIHHIISDGWTIALIMNKVMYYYRAIKEEMEYSENKENKGLYLQYIQWEQEYLSSEKYIQNAEYWKNKFKTVPGELSIEPYKNLNRQDYTSARAHFVIPADVVKDINRFCSNYNTTTYHMIMAALYIYIYKTTSREDIIVSTFTHNRMKWNKDTIGMFVSTIPVRLSIGQDMDFLSVLSFIKRELWMCMKNQNYPFDRLVTDIRENMDEGNGNYLNDILVSYQNAKYPEEVDYPAWYFNGNISNVITFHISDRGDKGILDFEIDYRTSLFDESDINRIFSCMCNLIKEGMAYPENKITQLDMLGQKQRDKLLLEFNATKAAYSDQLAIHQKFEEQAERVPNNIAVVFKGRTLTYSQLNIRANQLAWVLRNAGVNRDNMVALLLDRTEEMLIGILAVLKAGGGYLPIDPNYPGDRISYMIEDSGAEIILTKKNLTGGICLDGKKIFMDEPSSYDVCMDNLPVINEANDLAYIIYTSGSTGKPKGVMIEHQAVLNFIKGMTDCIDFHESKTILALTTISFDIFVLETLLPLSAGMKIVIADETEQIDPLKLNSLITENEVDIIQMTPSRMQLLLANEQNLTCLKSLKEILLGGEAVTEGIIKSLKPLTDAKLYNMYGPTETTVWSSVKEIENVDEITIGKPIANTNIYIVNRNLELVPLGVIGEICITGAGVARGYYKREDLNREKFVKIPKDFLKDGECYEVMYRTGDLGWWRTDGEIEFVGRMDTQVKLRGYRIELEEIEKVVMEYGTIHNCAVIVKENENGHKYLVLYYAAEAAVSPKELDLFMKEKLPYYMVPSDFIWLKELPMTPNGKLDRKSLPEPSLCTAAASDAFEAPGTECERLIADIWKKVLDKDMIDRNENFFDIGGNSFFLIMMHSQLDQVYQGKVTIADIFANPTISKLASFIEQRSDKTQEIEKILTVKLPGKYFFGTGDEQESCSLHMKLDPFLHDAILNKCRLNEIELDHFTLGMYLYLLAEVSQKDFVSVQAGSGDMESIRQISINFADISRLEDMFRQVKDLCVTSDNRVEYKPDNLKKLRFHKEPDSILPVFLYNADGNNKVPQIFDLILKIKNSKDGMEFFMDSNNDKISQKAMKALAEGYLEMLNAFVKQN